MNATDPHRHRRRSRRSAALLSIALPLAFLAAPLSAQNHIRVESTKGSSIDVQPGTLITLPIRISNDGDVRDYIALIPRLPQGWKQLTNIPSASINPGESAIRLVTLSPPKNVAAGSYDVVLSIIDSTHRTDEWLEHISVTVARLVTFEMVQIDAPRFSVGGDRMTYEYEVLNTGNDILNLSIEARSAQGFPITVDPPLLALPVGTGGRISVEVLVPADLERKEKHGLILTASPIDGGEAQSLTTLSDVLPRVESSDPDQLEFPLFAHLRYAGDNDQRGIQADLSGYGSLREDHADRLEFLLRTPETQSFTVLGIRDEYRIKYTHEDLRLYAGDWNYSLTTLTEAGRFASGLGGESRFGGVTLGGFVNTTRIGSPVRRQAAAYGRYDVTESTIAGLNLMYRSEQTDATIITSSIQTPLFRTSRLDLEAGASSGPGNAGAAVSARLAGSVGPGRYDVRFVNAGKHFASYYRDVQLASISFSGYATRDIRFDVLARDERRNTRRDTLVGFSPRTQSLQLGGGYSNLLSLYYRTSVLADPLSPSGQDRREDVVQVRMSHSFAGINAAAYMDLGTLTDRSLGSSGPTRRYALNLTGRPWARQTYTAMLELSRSPDLATGTQSERISATLNANYRITNDTRAQLTFFTSRATTPVTQRYAILDATLDHIFPSHHRVGGRVRHTSLTGSKDEVAFSVEYGLPVAIPLGTIGATGVFSGRILDQQGNGLPGVYVTAGSKAAVTDADGLFIMRDMSPGTYSLQVDRGTLGLERILHVPLPMDIQVIGGEESSVVLRSVTPGLVQGTTKLFNTLPTGVRDSSVIVEEPVDASVGIVVDLTNGGERYRRITNAKGVFVFTDLRPGIWKATFTALRLPDNHAIEQTETAVEVRPGESSNLEIKVVPRPRRIRILQEGGVLKPKQ